MTMTTEHVMTTGKLIEMLSELPLDTPIVMSKDGEGNGFSPLALQGVEMENVRYEQESTWAGELVYASDCDEDNEEDEYQACNHAGCRYDDATPVVVLWPVN